MLLESKSDHCSHFNYGLKGKLSKEYCKTHMLLEEEKILKIKQVLLVRRKRVGPFLNLLLFTRKYTSANLKSLQLPCSVEVKISEMWKTATLWQESLCTHTHTRTLAFIFIQLFPDNTNHQILVRRWDRLLLHYSQFWKLLSKNLGIKFVLSFWI